MQLFSRSPGRSNRPRRTRLSATTALAVCGFTVAPLAAHAAPANVEGQWSQMISWPRIPIHAALLPDGKVATYGATPQGNQGGLDVDVWDPKLGFGDDAHVTLPNGINVDSFCSGLVMGSWNGELLMVGGSTNASDGNTLKAESFSYKTKKLTQLQSVRYPRWYSTTTTLPDGRIIVNGGVVPYSNSADASTTAELYTPGQGWRTLDGTTQARQNGSDTERRYWFPHVFPTANNKVFVIAGKIMYRLGYDGNGSVGDFQAFNGSNWGGTSTAVLFAPNKVLQFGGGWTMNDENNAPPGSKAASVVDFSTYPYKVTDTGSMAYGRHWVTGTVLPNGEVLATGGAEGNNTLTNVAYAAEIWNPQSGQWRTGASMQLARLYHSTALLLPDGRVLVGGGGAPGPVNGNNAQVYSPPYLFGADGNPAQRPVIGTEPGTVRLGQTLQVNATGARPVARFTMVKTGSVTHDFNTDQRFLEVPFRKTGDNYDLTITGNALEATPGYYMLFAINDQGVPSIAKMMRIPSPTADTGDTPPAGQNGETKGIATAADASGGNGGNGGTASAPKDGTVAPLVAANSNLCLSVQGGSNADGAQLIQEACNGSAIQKWTWKAANGGYTLVNGQSNKCVDVLDWKTEDGAKLVQWPCWGGDVQVWKPVQTDKGLNVVSKLTNKCLDVAGVSQQPGAQVWQWTCNGQANQAWKTAVPNAAPNDGAVTTLAAAHSNLCLSVQGGSNADKAQLIQETCNGSAVQNWTWKAANGGFMLVNAQSNKCVDTYNAGNDGAALVQWPCWGGDNQIWKPTQTNAGMSLVSKQNNKCMDVSGVSTQSGAQIWQWTCNGQANQAWKAVAPNAVPTDGAVTALSASHSNLCLSVRDGSNAEGAQVVQETCNGSAIQKWTWKAANGGFMLVNSQSNKCVDNYNVKTDGANLVQWGCWGGDNQIWKPTQTDKGLTLTSKQTNKCADVTGAAQQSGAQVIQWTCGGQANQVWRAR